jgi:hypothetical protein
MVRPSEWDVSRPLPKPPSLDDDEEETATLSTSVEISLLELPDETEQELQDRLELLSPTTGELADRDCRYVRERRRRAGHRLAGAPL